MTGEQTRTLDHFRKQFDLAQWRLNNNLVRTVTEHQRYNDAVAHYISYRLWLDTSVLNRKAA